MSITRTTPSISRRGVLRTGAIGIAALAGGTAFASPALADSPWTQAFITRLENTQGFDLNAMTQDQIDNAKFIIAVGKGHGIADRGIQVAITTAIVEAWLRNYGPQVDGTSGGLFQQQTSVGWGTYDQVRNKKLAIDAFFGLASHTSNPGLLDITPDYKTLSVQDAAQSVQHSAYPERYGQQAAAGKTIFDRYAAGVAPYTG